MASTNSRAMKVSMKLSARDNNKKQKNKSKGEGTFQMQKWISI